MPITTQISLIPGYNLTDLPRLILPFLILYIQAYLLLSRGPSSRWIRIAILPASLASLKAVWLDRRITDERYVIWNFVLGCAAVFYAVLSIVYSLLSKGPTRTPSYGPARDAFHLITSPRLIGWSGGLPLVVDPYPEFPPFSSDGRNKDTLRTSAVDGQDQAKLGSSNGNSNGIPRNTSNQHEQHHTLTQREINAKTLRIHLRYLIAHYIILDTLTFGFHTLGRHGIGHPRGGSLYASAKPTLEFFHHFFPSLAPSSWAEWMILQAHIIIVHLAVGMAFYQGLCFGYHVAACVGLLVGWGNGGDWQRLMKRPLGADSLVGFWGRRWHQIFRQAFVAPSLLLPARYRSLASPLIAFSISSVMHEMGTLTMVGTTSPHWVVTRSFLWMALGLTAEISFKKLTGRRVQGWWGRIWFWSFVIVTARGLVDAWLQFGVGGARLLPEWMSVFQLLRKAGCLDRWLGLVEPL